MYILIGIKIKAEKQIPREQDVTNPTIHLLTQPLIFLTMELADMPTKFQHTLQRSNSCINIITNQLNTQCSHRTKKNSTRLDSLVLLSCYYIKRDSNIYGRYLWGSSSYIFGKLRHTLCSSITCWCLLIASCCAFN